MLLTYKAIVVGIESIEPCEIIYLHEIKKAPDFIFRDDSNVTDKKVTFIWLIMTTLRLRTCTCGASDSLINIIMEIKNMNGKRTLTGNKVIQPSNQLSSLCGTNLLENGSLEERMNSGTQR